MPKLKTKKSISKRVKVTAGGKLLMHKPGAGHLRSRKTPKRLRNLRRQVEVPTSFARQVRRMLGS